MKLPERALSALAPVLNGALAAADGAGGQLAQLEGRRIRLRPAPLDLSLLVLFADHGVQLRNDDGLPADVDIEGTPLQLLAMARAGGARAGSGVKLSGDLATAQALQSLLGAVDIDWEDNAARYLGDVTAHRLGRAGRGVGQWLRETGDAVQDSTAEYLRNELDLVPHGEEVTAFAEAVDRARDDLERLEARVRRLEGSR